MKKSELKQIKKQELVKTHEGALMNNTYLVSLRTEYGTLNDIEVRAEDEDEAFDKAMKKAEDAIYTSKIDQIEEI
jgi:hypothetical protein